MLDATLHPVEAHVKCFGAFPAHVDSDDYLGGCVVSLYRSWRLRMTHFNQGCADGHNLLAIDEYHTGFSLGSECNDGADGMALGEDWSVLIVSRPDGGRGGVSIR